MNQDLYKAAYPDTPKEIQPESVEINEENIKFLPPSEEITDPAEMFSLLESMTGSLTIGDNRVAANNGEWL